MGVSAMMPYTNNFSEQFKAFFLSVKNILNQKDHKEPLCNGKVCQ